MTAQREWLVTSPHALHHSGVTLAGIVLGYTETTAMSGTLMTGAPMPSGGALANRVLMIRLRMLLHSLVVRVVIAGEQDLMDGLRATSIPMPALAVAQASARRRHWSAPRGLPDRKQGRFLGHGVRGSMVVDPAPAAPLYVAA